MNVSKTMIAALAIVAGAALTTATAKKKVAEKKAPEAAVVELKSGSDSLSYAAGYAQTNGLLPFLQTQLNVDTAYMADFIQGLRDAKEKSNDPRFKAYSAGAQINQMIQERMIAGIGGELKDTPDTLNTDLFYAGFLAAIAQDSTKYNLDGATKVFQEKMERAQQIKVERATAAGKAWLEENKTKPGVQVTPSGLQYKVITMGDGEKPQATDEVGVKYEGHLIDGTEFDSSYKRKDPVTRFKANQVIKGWTEALTMMPVGSKWELYIPQEIGYGARGMGKIPAYATLIFTVELVEIIKPQIEEPKAEEPAADEAKEKAAKKPVAKKKARK